MKLNYKNFGNGKPLIILHGLMGALDNWQSIAKVLSENFSVFILDQRNHGKSPHSNDFNYDLMASDLNDFLKEQTIENCILLGHSMGGKVAMHFALLYPEKVEKLIVADIAPVLYENQHSKIIDAIKSIDLDVAQTRDQVQEQLSNKILDLSTVHFLMKGLYRDDLNKFQWRFNIESIEANYDTIADFPQHENQFLKPTLFIKGDKSNYINSVNHSSIAALFPNNEIAEISGAGHWVHADNPAEFLSALKYFLAGN